MNVHVLFVDDEADLRDIVGDALADCGYQVTLAADGHQALEILRGETRFSHVISDVSMPGGLTGLDLATFALEYQPEAKVIVSSGYQRSQLPQIPAHVHFLPKPYRIRQLLALLEA